MPLFQGEGLVDVPLPGGGTVKLPASVVKSLAMPPQEQPDIVSNPTDPDVNTATPGVFLTPSAPLPDVAQAAPVAPDAPLPTQTTPDYPAAIVPKGGTLAQGRKIYDQQQVAAQKQVLKQQAAQAKKQAAYEASPAGQRDKALQSQLEGQNKKIEANENAAHIDAAAALMIAGAKEEGEAKMRAAEEESAKVRADRDAAREKKLGALVDTRVQLENTKIDRGIDHPILAAISLALAGLGSAMKGESENPALKVLWAAIDRKVAGQMADLEQRGKLYGMQKDELAEFDKNFSDKIAMKDYLTGIEATRTARKIDLIASQSASEKIKAEAGKISAQYYADGAALTAAAIDKQLDYDQRGQQHRESIGLGYSQLKENKRQFNETMLWNREKEAAERLAALAAARKTGGDAAMKELHEAMGETDKRGVRSVANPDGGFLLTKEGKDAVAVADQMDAEAKKIRSIVGPLSPEQEAKATMLEQKAKEVRTSAQALYAVRFNTPEIAGKFTEKYGATQSFISIADEIKDLYDAPGGGRALFNKGPQQQELDTKMAGLGLKIKTLAQLGAYDKGLAALLDRMLGKDITKEEDAGNIAHMLGIKFKDDPEGFKKRLDALADDFEKDIRNELAPRGLAKDQELFFRRKKPENNVSIKAGTEARTEMSPGEDARKVDNESWFTRNVYDAPGNAVSAVKSAFTGDPYESAAQGREQRAGDNSSLKYPYLSEKQGAAFDTWQREIESGDPDRIKQAKTQLVAFATTGPAEQQIAALKAIRGYMPDIYDQVKSKLPTKGRVAEQVARDDKPLLSGPPVNFDGTSTAEVARQALTDSKAFYELARRTKKGDQQAADLYPAVGERRKRLQVP